MREKIELGKMETGTPNEYFGTEDNPELHALINEMEEKNESFDIIEAVWNDERFSDREALKTAHYIGYKHGLLQLNQILNGGVQDSTVSNEG